MTRTLPRLDVWTLARAASARQTAERGASGPPRPGLAPLSADASLDLLARLRYPRDARRRRAFLAAHRGAPILIVKDVDLPPARGRPRLVLDLANPTEAAEAAVLEELAARVALVRRLAWLEAQARAIPSADALRAAHAAVILAALPHARAAIRADDWTTAARWYAEAEHAGDLLALGPAARRGRQFTGARPGRRNALGHELAAILGEDRRMSGDDVWARLRARAGRPDSPIVAVGRPGDRGVVVTDVVADSPARRRLLRDRPAVVVWRDPRGRLHLTRRATILGSALPRVRAQLGARLRRRPR